MSLVDRNRHHPRCDVGFLDLGSRLRRCTCHAALSLATDMKMCFRLVLVLHGNGEPIENTGGLICEYLPKGTRITTHQPYHRRHRRRTWVDAPEQPWDGSPHAKHKNAYSLLPPLDTKVCCSLIHRFPGCPRLIIAGQPLFMSH